LTLAKHIDVEVLAQTDSRSKLVVDRLGGRDVYQTEFRAPRPVPSYKTLAGGARPQRLFCLSDASEKLALDLVKDGKPMKEQISMVMMYSFLTMGQPSGFDVD
jgi:gelsolin